MASQEQLQQILDDDVGDDDSSSQSSTSNSDNEDTAAVAGPVSGKSISPFRLPSSIHPKKRLKLSMKLSAASVSNDRQNTSSSPQAGTPNSSSSARPSANPRSSTPPPPRPRLNKRSLPIKKKRVVLPRQDNAEGEIDAMVVDSDGEDDAVATAVLEEPTATAVGVKSSSTPQAPKKKPTALTPRNVKLPPFSSPGLLLPANNSVTTIRGKPATDDTNTNNGLTTMASVFDLYMNMVGYTDETRTKRPHIGSSVKREVGDMFDSNVQFSLHFPQLVPEDLLPTPTESEMQEEHHGLAESLISAFDTTKSARAAINTLDKDADTANGSKQTTTKRQKLIQYSDMAPLSLTLPYPEWYIEQQLEYAQKINKREEAILKYKKEVEASEMESYDSSGHDAALEASTRKPKTTVPPIPRPPSPPQLEHLPALDKDQFDDSQHPLYPPKAKQLVSHLDGDCFHITKGRYFGLTCNAIADPHFVGPCAPGISGLNSTTGNGLATAHSGGGVPNTGGVSIQPTPTNGISSKSSNSKKVPTTTSSSSTDISSKKTKTMGLTPTASTSALRMLIEEGGEEADKMRTCIIRSAVHASRSKRHAQAFQALNGKIYPEVNKAFTAYAGLKPCIRCKGIKEGSYYCRLRRKHKDLDYDGGDSSESLAPLFHEPLEDLLSKPRPSA